MTKRHNIWSHFRLAVLLAVLVLALCGCSSDDVRLPERVDLFRGQQFALASAVEIEGDPDAADVLAALAAADAHGVTVDFASADESVATVDELGIVQGVAPGATIVYGLAWWQAAIIAFDVVVGVLAVACAVFIVIDLRRRNK